MVLKRVRFHALIHPKVAVSITTIQVFNCPTWYRWNEAHVVIGQSVIHGSHKERLVPTVFQLHDDDAAEHVT